MTTSPIMMANWVVVVVLALSIIYFGPSHVVVVEAYTGAEPTWDGCLYFDNLNSKLTVVKPDLDDENEPTFPINSSLVTEIDNVGLYPSGLDVYDGKLFLTSYLNVPSYDIAHEMKPGPFLFDFSTLDTCLPGGAVIWEDVMYVACFTNPIPHMVAKVSVAKEDYGTLLGGTTEYPGNPANFVVVRNGTYNFVDGLTGDPVNYNGSMIFFSLLNLPYVLCFPVDEYPRDGNISHVWLFANMDDVESFPANYQSSIQGLAIIDDDLYVLWNVIYGNSGFGQIIAFDGDTSVYKANITRRTTELSYSYDLALGPDNTLFTGIPVSGFAYAQIDMYNLTTGEFMNVFYKPAERENSIVPQFLRWAPCPYYPEPSNGDSGLSTTVVIILSVVLPVFCLIMCCFLLLLIAFIANRLWNRRRRTYFVADEERIEMGRKGKTKFTYREIDPSELERGMKLGQGAFGAVYRGTYRGAHVAIKTFDDIKLNEADEDTLIDVREEAQMMHRLCNHPNVIKFVGAVTAPNDKIPDEDLYFAIVTEFCPHGSLYELLIKKQKKLPMHMLIRMARDIASGILHLHKEGVIHRDIATRNVLVGDGLTVYISDFGMARLKEGQEQNTTMTNIGPIKWMAPEAMTQRQYSEASDAFSYGVLLWEMVTRKQPWAGADPTQIILAVTKKNTRLHLPKDCDPVLRKIIKSVWSENPGARMKMEDIVKRLDDYVQVLNKVYGENDSDSEGIDTKTDDSSNYNSLGRRGTDTSSEYGAVPDIGHYGPTNVPADSAYSIPDTQDSSSSDEEDAGGGGGGGNYKDLGPAPPRNNKKKDNKGKKKAKMVPLQPMGKRRETAIEDEYGVLHSD